MHGPWVKLHTYIWFFSQGDLLMGIDNITAKGFPFFSQIQCFWTVPVCDFGSFYNCGNAPYLGVFPIYNIIC